MNCDGVVDDVDYSDYFEPQLRRSAAGTVRAPVRRSVPVPSHDAAGSIRSVGTPQVPSFTLITRVPGLRPGRTSETSTPAAASRARAASASGTRHESPQSRSSLAGSAGERLRELDRDAAHAQEHEPHPPVREAAIEREPQAEAIAIERDRGLGVRRLHHRVIDPADHRIGGPTGAASGRRSGEPCSIANSSTPRVRSIGRSALRQRRISPESASRPRPGATGAARARARRAPHARPPCRGSRTRARAAPLPAIRAAPRACAERAVALGREQLEIGVVEPEQRVRGALSRMFAAPRGAPREQRGVAARGVGEVAHREDHVVERIEHPASMPRRASFRHLERPRMQITDGRELIFPTQYADRGYPHDVWTRLRRESPVHRCEPPGYGRSGRSRSTRTSARSPSVPTRS